MSKTVLIVTSFVAYPAAAVLGIAIFFSLPSFPLTVIGLLMAAGKWGAALLPLYWVTSTLSERWHRLGCREDWPRT